MIARDVMTTKVISVHRDTPMRDIARTLLDNHISAVPVVDEAGRPIGIVSEGDLVARNDGNREARRDWWISLLAEGERLNEEFLEYARTDKRTAHQIMVAPVVTVAEDASLEEVARVLASYRIKRVPVLAHRRMVGIVSRADLVRAMSGGYADSRLAPAAPAPAILQGPAAASPPATPVDPKLTAQHFRDLIADHDAAEMHRRAAQRAAEAQRRHALVSSLIKNHIEDEAWRAKLHEASDAAAQGAVEYLLLRFPADLCSDGGRAINAPEPDWPQSLRGEAAEVYLRWENDLKPLGFHISARVLDFPGGMPGDIGLFLLWGSH